MGIREKIGTRILEIRKSKGLSQDELSELSGVGRSHISRIECGKYDVRIDILEKIANALDCKIEIIQKD